MAFVNVEGEVSRLNRTGNGFGVKEVWQVQGKERVKYWSVFPKEQVQVSVGDRVKVSGGLQTSVTDPKPDGQGVDRYYVDHVVGQARVEVVGAAGGGFGGDSPAGAGSPTPSPDSGAQNGFNDFDKEQPF